MRTGDARAEQAQQLLDKIDPEKVKPAGVLPADIERGDSLPLDETKAPFVKEIVGTKVAFFRYLRSKEFQETYFERLPLLMKTQGTFIKTLPLKRVLLGIVCGLR